MTEIVLNMELIVQRNENITFDLIQRELAFNRINGV